MNHHEAKANEHKTLLDKLDKAIKNQESKKKFWKENHTIDKARFDYQDSIGIVNDLKKQLWKFQ
tara:strand:- start:2131 stop:2322 length:192 start_codon:yes stop_codon:yes gene_type:complete